MISIVLADIFDAKVINDELKNDDFGDVFPKREGARDVGISKLGEMQLEVVISNAPDLFQAWHLFADFHTNPSVGGQVLKIVLADYFLGTMSRAIFMYSYLYIGVL